MTNFQPDRIAEGRAMLLGGLRRPHAFRTAQETMAAQWQAFQAMGMPPGRQGTAAYGVICGADPAAETMEYMTGVEVASLAELPPEYGRMRVPPQRYAVFTHRGHTSTLRETWDAIWRWLPGSGYASAQTPDFEIYDDRFDPATGTGEIEIWVPIQDA